MHFLSASTQALWKIVLPRLGADLDQRLEWGERYCPNIGGRIGNAAELTDTSRGTEFQEANAG